MKRFMLFLLLLSCTGSMAPAQSYIPVLPQTPDTPFSVAARATLEWMRQVDADDTTEGGQVNAFRRWMSFWDNRVCNNAPIGENRLTPMARALESFVHNNHVYCGSASAFSGDWQCLGPFTDYYGRQEWQGRVECLWVDPTDTNYILAGAHSGGIWKTTNGGAYVVQYY